jgi:hypothetical protein
LGLFFATEIITWTPVAIGPPETGAVVAVLRRVRSDGLRRTLMANGITRSELRTLSNYARIAEMFQLLARMLLVLAVLQLQWPVCYWCSAARSKSSDNPGKTCRCCDCPPNRTVAESSQSEKPKPNQESPPCPCHYQCCMCSAGYVPLSAPPARIVIQPVDRIEFERSNNGSCLLTSRLDRPPRSI